MQTPQCGPRRFRALAALALASGVLLLVPSNRASAAGHNGITSGLIESINDLVDVLGKAVRHGDRKEVRLIDHALEDLLRALEHEQKQHHHHHKGGVIHKGMQMAGKDRKPFDSLPTATDSAPNRAGKAKGKGNFNRGVNDAFRHCQETRIEDTSTSPPTTNKAGDTAVRKNAKVGTPNKTATATSVAIANKASSASKNPATTTLNTKSAPGIAATPSKTAAATTTKQAANAFVGAKQVAKVGKLPGMAQHTTPIAKKANAPVHVTNFARSGVNVGASVGQHRPATHAPVKKK